MKVLENVHGISKNIPKNIIFDLIKATNNENPAIKLENILIWGSNKRTLFKDSQVLFDFWRGRNWQEFFCKMF